MDERLAQALDQATLAGDELLQGVIGAHIGSLLRAYRPHDLEAREDNALEVTGIATRLGCAELAVHAWRNFMMVYSFVVYRDGVTAHDIDRFNADVESGVLSTARDEAEYLRREDQIYQPVLEVWRDVFRRFLLSLEAVYIDY